MKYLNLFAVVFASGMCLFAGFMVTFPAGDFLVNAILTFMSPSRITFMWLIVLASFAFSFGISGFGRPNYILFPFASMVAGGWLGFELSGGEVEPDARAAAKAVWQGAGVAGLLPFLPEWASHGVRAYVALSGIAIAIASGIGYLIRYLLLRAISSAMVDVLPSEDDPPGTIYIVNGRRYERDEYFAQRAAQTDDTATD